MSLIDWIIAIAPVVTLMCFGCYMRKYITGVSDFLVAGRLCRRYVINSANLANALGLVGLVAFIEIQYATGFALAFWASLTIPLGMIIALSGYCLYRFRETRVMSLGQFLEVRYSRKLRIFSCFLRSIAEMMANVILPAIAARFFICYIGLPQNISILGWQCPSFLIVIAITLTLATGMICMGGTLTILTSNAVMGICFMPLILFFAIFLLAKVSLFSEVIPVLSDRIAGESFLNPFDISGLRDFNLVMLIVTFIGMGLHKASGLTGTGNAALNAHEAKMGSILGTWRVNFVTLFFVVITIVIITVMHHPNYAPEAKAIRTDISQNIAAELIPDSSERTEFLEEVAVIPENRTPLEDQTPFSRSDNPDQIYFQKAQDHFGVSGEGNFKVQQFKTIFHQLMLPATLRHILPPGLIGLFCGMLILFILSTDDSRIYSASSTLVQDCIVPFYHREELPPEKHIFLIRIISVGVSVFFFCGSFFMSQLDYVNLFISIMYGMWLGGCGPMIVFGLYSRLGTTAGAWCSLISGMGINLAGILLQQNWAKHVYPFLEEMGWVDGIGSFLSRVSAPLNPYVLWEMNPLKFPINSYEIYGIAMLTSIVVYIVVSLLTLRVPFHLEKMLHRGIYAVESSCGRVHETAPQPLFQKIFGINHEYSCGDKAIVWSEFSYSFLYKFMLAFVVVVIWNHFTPWTNTRWGYYFLIVFLLIPGIAGVITTFWLSIGSFMDLRKMFKDLNERVVDTYDNGMVNEELSPPAFANGHSMNSQSVSAPHTSHHTRAE